MARQRFFCSAFVSLLVLALLPFPSGARADGTEVILPAGTLLRCTLDEPNFSTKTADVGDPVICHLNQLLLFDRAVFPRGAYLGGHLEAAKDPGHFVGKGYLQFEFDRIGMPEGVIPVPAKVISAKGYRVDRQGKIIGHGHATRDAVEWMIPPLWPEKVLTLPARGPRPTLKNEESLTLRLMDDVALPAEPALGWHYFGSPHGSLSGSYAHPSSYAPARTSPVPRPSPQTNLQIAKRPADPSARSSNVASLDAASISGLHANAVARTAEADPAAPTSQNVLVLRDGTHIVASALRIDGGQMTYDLADGTAGLVSLDDIDWTKTFEKNSENGVTLNLAREGGTR
ncbi:MAG TPA: hypothetical protein VEJ67_12260 [Candidatus Cybelea sp.]|nr:hypothetical protein [Candidatus Cybelea sp.]